MGHRALVAETKEDGKVEYEYHPHGALSAYGGNPFRGPFGPEEIEKIPEKHFKYDEVETAEDLEDFILNVLYDWGGGIERVWINGKCYDYTHKKPVLIECRTTDESAEDMMTEYGTIDDDFLENTDREVIDLREK